MGTLMFFVMLNLKFIVAHFTNVSQKEKRKYKDKKKKRKKHSATNGDLTLKEDDGQCKDIEQSGQPKEGFCLETDKLPFVTKSQSAIERLQTETFVNEAFSNGNFATDSQKEPRFKPGEVLLSRSVLAAEKSQAEDSRRQSLSKGVNGTDSCQRLQGVKSMTKGLTDSGLATVDKRSRLDSSGVLSNGTPVASSCMRPEQAENSVFSNGVLSTKRKRLQADNSGDSLLPTSVLAADCKKSNGVQTGRSLGDSFMQATNRTILQADISGNLLTSNNGLPSDFERPEKRFRADHTRSKVGASGAYSAIGQAENGKISNNGLPSDFERPENKFRADYTRLKVGTNDASSATGQVENGKAPYLLLANGRVSQEDKLKPDVQSNGANCGKMHTNSSTVRQPINCTPSATKCEEYDKRIKPGKVSLMNPMQASNTSSSPANGLDEKVFLGYSMASTCERSEQRLQGTSNLLTTGGSKAKEKRLEADSKGMVSFQDAGATCNKICHIASSRDDTRVLSVKNKRDKSFNQPSVLATDLEHTGSRLQANGFKNGVLSNGAVAGHTEEHHHSGTNLFSPTLTAAIGNNSADQIKASKAPLDFEEKSMKEKLMNLRIPHPGQVWIAMEDEDWLGSCKQQLQSKQGGKGEEASIQPVWAEAVLLPGVGLNALPYVILS
ncbi:hypothetical protein L7F22_060640 [Adiantum nelumboides]|nr:hypothetical protein [Adiantum nelumboides]